MNKVAALMKYFLMTFLFVCSFGSAFAAEENKCDYRDEMNKWIDPYGRERISYKKVCYESKPLELVSARALKNDSVTPLVNSEVKEGEIFVVESKLYNPNDNEFGAQQSEKFFFPEELITQDVFFSLVPPNKASDLQSVSYGVDGNSFQVNLKNVPPKSNAYVYFFLKVPVIEDQTLPRFYTAKQIKLTLGGTGIDKLVSVQLPVVGQRVVFNDKYYTDMSFKEVPQLDLETPYYIIFPFNNPNNFPVSVKIVEQPQSSRWEIDSDNVKYQTNGKTINIPASTEGSNYTVSTQIGSGSGYFAFPLIIKRLE
jgi:hypothetical protein